MSIHRSVTALEALRQKKDFVGGAVGGALAGTAFGVSGEKGRGERKIIMGVCFH